MFEWVWMELYTYREAGNRIRLVQAAWTSYTKMISTHSRKLETMRRLLCQKLEMQNFPSTQGRAPEYFEVNTGVSLKLSRRRGLIVT